MSKAVVLLCVELLLCSVAGAQALTAVTPHKAPGFALPDLSGSVRQLEDFKGKYLLVNFWAVWCLPCRAEMPSMQRLAEQMEPEQFEVLAIHVGPSQSSANQFAHSLGLTFPILVDEQMALTEWQVMGLPTTYLLDPKGNIVAKAVGERDWSATSMQRALKRFTVD